MKAETQSLLEKSRASPKAAELLRTEGYADFAASRAYYAMFYAAEALLLEQGEAFATHSGVIGAFGKLFAKAGVLDPKLHRYLIDAQDLRNVGDYGVGPSLTEAQVTDLLQWATEFVATAEHHLRRA